MKKLRQSLLFDGGSSYKIAQLPTEYQRQAIEERCKSLTESLQPCGSGLLRSKIAAVIGMIPSPGTDQSDPEAVISIYCGALSDLPSWAAEDVCLAALRGHVGSTSGRFRPTPGELHLAAEQVIINVRQEIIFLERLLKAKKIEVNKVSPERRAELVNEIKKLVRDTVKCSDTEKGSGGPPPKWFKRTIP